MLAHLRVAGLRRSAWPWRPVRSLMATAVARAEGEDEDLELGPGDSQEPAEDGAPEDPGYEKWLAVEGRKYEDATFRPRNWLGGEVPFPLNPTFKPPPPLSDALKSVIYEQFMSNPDLYNVRALSERHGISIKRVDAILRLKGLEEHWRKNKVLQTGFVAGMERILGVSQTIQPTGRQGAEQLGEDASEADSISDAAGSEKARERYQRLFWEPVPDGKEPVLSTFLEKEHAAKAEAQARKAARLVPVGEHTVERPGRPSVTFVDVGTRFVDKKEMSRRAKESQRRSLLKQHRRERTARGDDKLAV